MKFPDSIIVHVTDIPAVADALEKASALEKAARAFVEWWDSDSTDDGIDDQLEPLRAALREIEP